MFIGEFDILLMSLFKNRGQVTELNSPDDAFDQNGSFTLIVVNNEFSSKEFLGISCFQLSHEPDSCFR